MTIEKAALKARYYTAADLAARGSGDIPPELVSTTHLIYSSPATLAFNSPGAEGYGVKRAGLSVPDSVMLIVSPGCCGRNTSAISRMPGYEDRFFYLTMDETDLVTGRHLKKIPAAVEEICRGLDRAGRRPRVVMICITCVDALLGTDMDRICRRAEERLKDLVDTRSFNPVPVPQDGPGTCDRIGETRPGLSPRAAALTSGMWERLNEVRVQPCYMYALTREGRKPPMVHVRQSIYALLQPCRKKSSSVNILGFFSPLEEESELFPLLGQAGVRRIRQIGSCADYSDFQAMAEANFNLVLNPEARPAAYDLQDRLGIPFIELGRFYQIDRIRAQYAALGRVLDTDFEDGQWEAEAVEAVSSFRQAFPDTVFSIGEAMNGNPFELACALVREGFRVREIFGTVSEDSFTWIRLLAELSPRTRIYSNLHPSMLHYRESEEGEADVTLSIGRDAGWYHPDVPNVQWNADVQPFGYRAVTGLFRAMRLALETGSRGIHASAIVLTGSDGCGTGPVPGTETAGEKCPECPSAPGIPQRQDVMTAGSLPRGFRRITTPFAPDQSGAVSVLYDMGGICVICDAGGCTGNICGFDEPRWFGAQSAVFSAGLRDMDAILGRDDRLVEKLADAAGQVPASFAAIVGTPVPAVIGTDYRALCRMAAKKTGLPVIGVNTDGMDYYDKGIEKTYIALLDQFCRPSGEDPKQEKSRMAGVWGFSPLDFAGILSEETLRERIRDLGYDEVLICGAGADLEDLKKAGSADRNFALSPAGAGAAKWLQDRYGTPWEYLVPNAEEVLTRIVPDPDSLRGSRVLVVHQQVLADRLRKLLAGTADRVDTAGFFMMKQDLLQDGDSRLREETDLRSLVQERGYDTLIADRSLAPVLAGLPVRLIHLPHFAVSGDLPA